MDEGMTEQQNLNRGACWLLLLLMISAAATAQPRESRFAISSQRVAEALAAAGLQVSAGQVKFLSPVSATGNDSGLQVMNVATWTGGTRKAELRCHDRRACLPFYVLLTSPRTADMHDRTSTSGTGSPQPGAASPTPSQQILMRDGDRATLVFEESALRITLPVICLQSGNRGQKIRVVSADHKRFFTAEIVESGLLRATL